MQRGWLAYHSWLSSVQLPDALERGRSNRGKRAMSFERKSCQFETYAAIDFQLGNCELTFTGRFRSAFLRATKWVIFLSVVFTLKSPNWFPARVSLAMQIDKYKTFCWFPVTPCESGVRVVESDFPCGMGYIALMQCMLRSQNRRVCSRSNMKQSIWWNVWYRHCF